MAISESVRKYVEMATREILAEECPGYSQDAVERVVNVTMKYLRVTRKNQHLIRAIELAAKQQEGAE